MIFFIAHQGITEWYNTSWGQVNLLIKTVMRVEVKNTRYSWMVDKQNTKQMDWGSSLNSDYWRPISTLKPVTCLWNVHVASFTRNTRATSIHQSLNIFSDQHFFNLRFLFGRKAKNLVRLGPKMKPSVTIPFNLVFHISSFATVTMKKQFLLSFVKKQMGQF